MEFSVFKRAVAAQFAQMSKGDLFRTKVTKDQLWETYLKSFPEGSNPIYKERTEHDCNCCKQFIRAVGDVVAIVDGKLVSIWDVQIPTEPSYQVVTDALSTLVKSFPIEDVFRHFDRVAGVDKNFQELVDGRLTWQHFFVNLPPKYILDGKDIASFIGEQRSLHDVLYRSLQTITDDAVDTVLELIGQNSLYRGEEHKFAVSEFKKLKKQFKKAGDKDLFAWASFASVPVSVSKIRNTSIGTLLVDLSEGMDMEDAVKKFEAMVAPTNYKRPTALVTQKMVDQAREKVEALGLTSALARRYATLSDITVNNILFANRDARNVMGDSAFDGLATATVSKKAFDKVEEITIDKFIADVLPTATSLEVMFEGNQSGNLVSLVAPVDPTAGSLFKWSNNFSWAYAGDVTDSIKERVKKAGGNVTGDLCCRLAWYNHDDLDLHMIEPNGNEVYFGNRRSAMGGVLDVDMNAGAGTTREPVENIYYSSKRTMREGKYKLFVHQFRRRESTNVGFDVEIDFMGDVVRFSNAKAVPDNARITVAEFNYTHANGIEFKSSMDSKAASREVWGIKTNEFHQVNVMMMSPNYWDGQLGIGNRHFFFMLDGCASDVAPRGFFNEYLKEDLNQHRKVFEVLGSKMKVADSSDQLSGLGFSSTKSASILCRVKGSFTRVVRIVF